MEAKKQLIQLNQGVTEGEADCQFNGIFENWSRVKWKVILLLVIDSSCFFNTSYIFHIFILLIVLYSIIFKFETSINLFI